MFAGRNKNGVIISDSPVVSAGISSFIMRNFDNTNLICCDFSHGFQSHALLGKHVIICDLSGTIKTMFIIIIWITFILAEKPTGIFLSRQVRNNMMCGKGCLMSICCRYRCRSLIWLLC